MSANEGVDWSLWLRRWDDQQTRYVPRREQRFDAMADAVSVVCGHDFVMLDLACGPGAVSQRILDRFPKSRSLAVDMNPALLHLGERAVGSFDGRLRWARVNLMDNTWTDEIATHLEAFGHTHFDAVLSTTALHWLPIEHLVLVYRDLGRLLRPGGLFLNGDDLPFAPNQPTLRKLAATTKRGIRSVTDPGTGVGAYQQWWDELEADALTHDPELGAIFAEHHRIDRARPSEFPKPILQTHIAALADAGFTEVDTIWQDMGVRILLAVLGS